MKQLAIVLTLISLAFTVAAEENLITLETAVEIALTNNLQIAISDEQIKQAEYDKETAHTLFFPRLTSSFSYTRLDEGQEMGGMKIIDANLYNIGLTITQPIYTGGKLNAVYQQSLENLKRTGFEKGSAVNKLVEDVNRGYFSILKAERGLETANRLKELATEHLRTSTTFFEEGLAIKSDVLKTEVYLAEIENNILQAENAIAIAKASFNFLLNQSLSTEFAVENILDIQREKKDLEYWTDLAYKQRPEIKAMDSADRIYKYAIESEKSGYKPQIAFFTNYTIEKGTQGAIDKWQDSWQFGVAMELDIWNWGETRNKVQRAVHAKKEIENQQILLLKSIELEVKSAFLNLQTAKKQIESIKKSMETAEENLRITKILYSEGMTTTTEVLDAHTDLAVVLNNYYQSLYDYQIAYAGLEKAAGVLIARSKK